MSYEQKGAAMSQEEYAKIIAKNLKRIAYEHHKTQADIARDLKLKQGTVSSWMVGTRIPRMDKIDLLCNYFNCSRTELMEDDPSTYKITVSKEEREILALIRSLSESGQAAAISYLSIMAMMPEYKKTSKAG